MVLQYLVNGLLLGGIYALIGVGFSLVYGVMSVINLAHGSLIMLGGYITYQLTVTFGMNPFVALIASGAVMFIIGYLIQYTVINRVVRGALGMTVVLTYGLDLVLRNTAQAIWTADYKSISTVFSGESLEVGPVVIPYVRLAVFLVAVVMALALFGVLNFTRIGKGIRATAQNKEAAGLMGIDTNLIYAFTFAIGAAIAGVAGGLFGMIYSFYPDVGASYLGKAFAVAVIGGLGNVPGALVGGLVLGLVEIFGAWWLGASWQGAICYIIIIIALIVRPQGLLAKRNS